MSELKIITKSKIICTLGPSTSTKEKILDMAEAGMDVARINFSYGTQEYKSKIFKRVREIDSSLAIMCDIQGPKIRIGEVESNGAVLIPGNSVILTSDDIVGTSNKISVSYKKLPKEVKHGDLIYINDGLICLRVEDVKGNDINCQVLVGGLITSKKGVNVPHTEISMRVPTEKDKEDIKLIAKLDPEYLAISFVRDGEDVRTIREMLKKEANEKIKLVSKIERPFALDNFDEILKESDAIMVARGDLGVEVPFEDIIPEQKKMIRKANIAGKPVIVATQMLESMINAPVPTRAEVSDVFNAIEDGADSVMLSAETAAGRYPVESVSTMERIIKSSESQIPPRDPDDYDSNEESISEIIGHIVHSACKEFFDISLIGQSGGKSCLEDNIEVSDVKILVLTRSGLSARMVSKYRPLLPIIGVTPEERTARELRLVWGVEPIIMKELAKESNTYIKIQKGTQKALELGFIEKRDKLIIAGNMMYLPSKTNMVSIFRVSDILDSI